MKGDFSRKTFKREKRYSGVLMQQGRVNLDADFNEQNAIQNYIRRTALSDVIGLCGGPQDDAGFDIVVGGDGKLHVTKGRYYVDGILCENNDDVLLSAQPDLPGQTLATGSGYYLAYLDTWQRHITVLEDNEIREVALGGPDTTTRAKTIAQVKWVYTSDKPAQEPPGCADDIFKSNWNAAVAPSTCLLTADTEAAEDTKNQPCIVPARAGYRGLENQLYRVEIHTVSPKTFKWSRENGSVVFPITFNKFENDSSYVTLDQLGKDKVLSLNVNDWVEILGDTTELNDLPGTMAQVMPESDIARGKIVLSEDVSKHKDENNLKLRRWEQKNNSKVTLKNGVVPFSEGDIIPLEDGVVVKFEKVSNVVYHTGDYWMIPARTAIRNIEWPHDNGNPSLPVPQPPLGIRHNYCRLAVLNYDGKTWKKIHDCRRLFPPLTELLQFAYVSGDGQEAMPGDPLTRPVQVSLSVGLERISGAVIRFTIIDGAGRIKAYKNETDTPCANFTSGGSTPNILVTTGADGMASACWRPGSNKRSQQVEANLVEVDGKSMLAADGTPFLPPVRFNANLSIASQVSYDSTGCKETEHPDAATVQAALDALYCNAALYYVSGDGQEAPPGALLPKPLQVRVANGKWPVKGADVIFAIEDNSGGILDNGTVKATKVEVITDENGLASCLWQLGKTNPSQQVTVVLKGVETLPIYFDAGFRDTGTGCCITVGLNGKYDRLDQALVDLILEQKLKDICICLLPGSDPQVLPGKLENIPLKDSELSISITGHGHGSRIIIDRPMQSLTTKLFSITGVDIEYRYLINADSPGLIFDRCDTVNFESCRVSGATVNSDEVALLSIGITGRLLMKDNTLRAINAAGDPAIAELVKGFGRLEYLARLPVEAVTMSEREINEQELKIAKELAGDSASVNIGKALLERLSGLRANMSKTELVKFNQLGVALSNKGSESVLFKLLGEIRLAVIKRAPGVALILGQGLDPKYAELAKIDKSIDETPREDMLVVLNNEISGMISLYDGAPVMDYSELEKIIPVIQADIEKNSPQLAGIQGSLEVTGNHLVGITVGARVLTALEEAAKLDTPYWLLNIFARCVLSKNVMEGVSLIVSQHLALASNDFAMGALPPPPGVILAAAPSITEARLPGRFALVAGGVSISDSSVFTGNTGCRPGVQWRNITFSPLSQQTANPWMNIA